MHVMFFCMIVVVDCCLLFFSSSSFFFWGGGGGWGDTEFLWMALLYLSFIAVTFHLAPPFLFFQAFFYLKIYKNSSTSFYSLQNYMVVKHKNQPFLSPWKPIKIRDLYKSFINSRRLLNKHLR